jgi:hypothetical protein
LNESEFLLQVLFAYDELHCHLLLRTNPQTRFAIL